MTSKFENLEHKIQMNWLLDYYGGLLTDKQREILILYYQEDLSLAEIAVQNAVSRQNIHDMVNRGGAKLLHFEETLKLVERSLLVRETLGRALGKITAGTIADAAQEIKNAIQQLEGE